MPGREGGRKEGKERNEGGKGREGERKGGREREGGKKEEKEEERGRKEGGHEISGGNWCESRTSTRRETNFSLKRDKTIIVINPSTEGVKVERRESCCTTWVQCSYPSCKKWRRLSSDVDPSALPEDWSCSQNPDLQYNSCNVPEETWSGSEDEVVHVIYFPGSIVWAKQYGYPWWPGIIEADPDIGEHFLFSTQADSLPSKYHVTFFGHSVTRAWISASLLKNYGEPPREGNALVRGALPEGSFSRSMSNSGPAERLEFFAGSKEVLALQALWKFGISELVLGDSLCLKSFLVALSSVLGSLAPPWQGSFLSEAISFNSLLTVNERNS
uniref:Zinc finger CW-type PWWP domain protein 1 n=1 Tax=Naja naja TaxID=35670 RepID=A0A8C6VGA9_NAJNA